MSPSRPTAAAAEAILHFWFEESKPYQWFRRDHAFDRTIKSRFGALHEAAIAGKLDVWRAHSRHSLSLIILLDQFSRNIYRDDPRAFAQDAQALDVAREAIRRRFDKLYDARERAFFYMPFMHSEDMGVQEECVALFKSQLPSTMNVPYAIEHRDIVKRFGRFPHRNQIFARASTPEEVAFLKAGGFNP
jgi:uncharacterized protein (DUF924 family)